MSRHKYGQTYTADQLAHADAVRAAQAARRAFHWVAQTAPQAGPASWAAIVALRFLPGDLVWTPAQGWQGRAR